VDGWLKGLFDAAAGAGDVHADVVKSLQSAEVHFIESATGALHDPFVIFLRE
jgi:hypothetical protein